MGHALVVRIPVQLVLEMIAQVHSRSQVTASAQQEPVLANRHRDAVANLKTRLSNEKIDWQESLEETLRQEAASAAVAD
jgi:short subunit dehydrogenase-like uncharacterized protein